MKNTQDINAEAVRSSALLAIATAALERISKCEDAPDIDATGEWQTGLHCGVEDRDCQDRYQGADYGHTVGVEKGLEWASNKAKHALEQMANVEVSVSGAADGIEFPMSATRPAHWLH